MNMNMKTVQTLSRYLALLTLICASFLLSGCGITKPADASFASVVIKDRSINQIRNAAGQVFTADGYRVMIRGNEMKCEKEGTRAAQLAYGSWVDDAPVDVRVLANIVQLSPDSFRLECKAYIVKSPGDPTFEEVIRLQNIRSRPYQDLLDKVADKLK